MEVIPPDSPATTPGVLDPPATLSRRPGLSRGVRGTVVPTQDPGPLGQAVLAQQVAMMTAARVTPTAIARGLRLTKKRVDKILGQIETAGLVEDFRKIVRAHALSESLDIAVKGMAWVNQAIDSKEAKTFDLVTRGLSNMEKVWSSAAGEHRPQGVQVAVINQTGDTSKEIAALVEMLVGPTR